MRIKSIKINAFRGIPEELDLDLDGKSLLLLGENGTGKSSVIDAIEFFFTGKISHLKSKGSLALNDHGPNTKNPEKAKISIEINPGRHLTSRTFSSDPSFPESLQDNIALANNGRFILRRSQILDLINTNPSNRYKFISDILGVDELDKIDTAMYQAKKYLIDDVKRIENKIGEITEEINGILQIQDSKYILSTINQLLQKEDLESIKSIAELEECINKINEMTKSSDNELIAALNNIFSILKEIPLSIGEIHKELSDAENHKKLIKTYDQSELHLLKILKNSLEIIDEDTDKCPICENTIDSEKLLEKINKRLESLESLEENNGKLKNSLDNVKGKLQSINTDLVDLSVAIGYFGELNKFKDGIGCQIEALNDFQKIITSNSFLQEEVSKDIFELSILSLKKILKEVAMVSEELSGSIKLSKRDERLQILNKVFSELYKNLQKQDKNLQKIKIVKNHVRISEIMYNDFSSIKKRKIQEVYDAIKENVERYYKIIHPQESYENISLDVDLNPKKKGSTDLRMTIFGEEDQDPRALSSEGHLDSLGLCIFLALFEKTYEDFPLLVLDDVVTTMDSRHRENVCQLLFEEFGDKQLIITTHDSIWFDQLKAAQRVHNLGNEFKNFTIVKWDEYYGPDIRPYKVRWEKIENSIKNGDKHCAGNEGRRYLEWLLEDICIRTKAKISAKKSGYEVNDLLEPAKSRLIDLIKDEKYQENIENSFENLNRTIMMGNLLSHDNLMAGNVSIDEVKRFCSSIHQIDEMLTCPKCKAPINYYRNLKILRCSNRKCNDPLEIKAK